MPFFLSSEKLALNTVTLSLYFISFFFLWSVQIVVSTYACIKSTACPFSETLAFLIKSAIDQLQCLSLPAGIISLCSWSSFLSFPLFCLNCNILTFFFSFFALYISFPFITFLFSFGLSVWLYLWSPTVPLA